MDPRRPSSWRVGARGRRQQNKFVVVLDAEPPDIEEEISALATPHLVERQRWKRVAAPSAPVPLVRTSRISAVVIEMLPEDLMRPLEFADLHLVPRLHPPA
jgi:hypothetical protein